MSAETPTAVAPAELDRDSIKAASARGLAVTSIAQVIRFSIQFVSSVIMARLLMPADFGLVAMAAPLIAFVQLLAEVGLTQATVQRATISQDELSFLFWIGLATSVGTGAIAMAASPLAGIFYHEPRVTGVVFALGAIVSISGLFGQHNALLNRSLRFAALAVVEVGSFLAGSIVGICAAWSGMGHWAIVLSQGATSITMLVLAWIFTCWVPSLPRRIGSARAMLGFGGDVMAFNVVNFFARNLDNILIGRYSGEAALGQYDRAYKLLLFPLSQITAPIAKIANPVLARALAEPHFYRRAYFRLLDAVLLLTFPIAIFAGINHQNLIYLVLGPQWTGAAPIFAVLAVGALFAPVSNSTGWLLVTQGRTAELRNYGAISAAAFVLSFIAGLPWGPLGVAVCYIAVGVIQGPILWWATTRRGPVATADLMRNLVPYGLAALPVAILNLLAVSLLPRSVAVLLGALASSYAVFLLSLLLLPEGRNIIAPYTDKIGALARHYRRTRQPGRAGD